MRGITRSRAVLVVGGAAALVALLSGCVSAPAPAKGPSGSATASATPTGTPTVAATACDTVTTPDAVRALVGGSGEPQTFTDLQPGDADSGPWPILAANGSYCAWGGLGPLRFDHQQDPSVVVQTLPHARNAWQQLVDEATPTPGAAYTGGEARGGNCQATTCSTNVLVGDTWLAVTATSATALAEPTFHAAVQGMVTALGKAPVPSALPKLASRPACDDAGIVAALSTAYGLTTVHPSAANPPPFSVREAANRLDSAFRCDYRAADTEAPRWAVEITGLSNAATVFTAAATASPDVTTRSPLTIDGVTGEAATWSFQTEDSWMTVVDVLHDGSWLQVLVWGKPNQAAATQIAQKLLSAS